MSIFRALTREHRPEYDCRDQPFTKSRNTQIDIDFDLLLTCVEGSILADQRKRCPYLTPKELLARSNPGMYYTNMEHLVTARDLTNPREMYNILSNRTKSIEDLALKLKRELSQTCQPTGFLPTLSRTLSMSEIDQPVIRDLRLGNKPCSHAEGKFEHGENKLEMLVLNNQKPNIEDIKPADKENIGALNLPNLNKQVRINSDLNSHLDGAGEQEQVLVELPVLYGNRNMANGNVDIAAKNDEQIKHLLHVRRELSTSDSKLQKWFSEMPNEVFDKAQRALMEESIKDKLSEYQRKRNRKMNFPNQNLHVWLGSSIKKVPNTYLELRVDSFGRHLDGKDDKLSKYKMQQKSLHNLKMKDVCETDRSYREENLPRLALQHRSLTTLALTKTKPKPDNGRNGNDSKDVIKIPTERGLTTVYMNDAFEPVENNYRIKQRHSVSNFEEYKERLNLMREAQEIQQTRSDKSRPNSPPPNTMIDGFDHTASSSNERDTTKAAIVNLSLKKEVPKSRKPVHIEKSLKETADTDKGGRTVSKSVNPMEPCGHDEIDGMFINEDKLKPDALVTKIPTAQSTRTSESKSSSNSQGNKAVLKRFNTLEVFAEHGKPHQLTQKKDGLKESRLKKNEGLRGIPSLRLDLRHNSFTGAHTMREPLPLPTNDVKKQELVFRFEPGEVFISRKNHNQIQNHTRSSERARVIYGKIVNNHRDWLEGKDTLYKSKEDLRDGNSFTTNSTRLDGYKAELSRFESRALNGSMTSYSSRREDGARNNMFVLGSRNNTVFESNGKARSLSTMNEVPADMMEFTVNGINKRHAATETDLLGSERGSARSRSAFDTYNAKDMREMRRALDMDEFIVENDDGESLGSGGSSVHDPTSAGSRRSV